MKLPDTYIADELKNILKNIQSPDLLDAHLWTESLAVCEGAINDDSLRQKSLGIQLIAVLSQLFFMMLPSTPPRRSKRLDTRWGQFGILAAQYFAPFLYGSPYPTSLRDAAGRIDQAILLFVFGRPKDELSKEEQERYKVIGDEAELIPISTLSDWHTKGLKRFAEIFLNHEQYLSDQKEEPSIVLRPPTTDALNKKENAPFDGALPSSEFHKKKEQPRFGGRYKRFAYYSIGAVVIIALYLLGVKAWRIYQLVSSIREEVAQLQNIAAAYPNMSSSDTVGPLLFASRRDLTSLKLEIRSLTWLGHWFGWIPVYGGDLAAAETLVDMAVGVTIAADEAYQSLWPIWQGVQEGEDHLDLDQISTQLVEVQPRLMIAKIAIEEALTARSKINENQLSSEISSVITRIDPYIQVLNDSLSFAVAAPVLLGAAGDPQTYLLLLQNEDELRPTGGFITAVGSVVIQDGGILSFQVIDSSGADDLTKPYPPAPWQLERYMNSQAWVLRDSNWYPDFPLSAKMAEYLYAYKSYHGVDGVIAIDQQAVRALLTILGPVTVEGVSFPVTADNLIETLRAAKKPTLNEDFDHSWVTKTFISKLADAMLKEIQTDPAVFQASSLNVIVQTLEEHHILMQFDDPTLAAALSKRGWDGAVQPGKGDFLMVVDSNIGFNKVNAVIAQSLLYSVDLSDPTAPFADLTVIHENRASSETACVHWVGQESESYDELINRCYWNYLRVYKSAGTQLLDATPHAIPAEWMILNQEVPARIDPLDDEHIPGVTGFGTLLVVPGGSSLETTFRFSLPASVLEANGSDITYHLRIQKQPGTTAIPIEIHIQLAPGATITQSSPQGSFDGNILNLETSLKTDFEIMLIIHYP